MVGVSQQGLRKCLRCFFCPGVCPLCRSQAKQRNKYDEKLVDAVRRLLAKCLAVPQGLAACRLSKDSADSSGLGLSGSCMTSQPVVLGKHVRQGLQQSGCSTVGLQSSRH